MNLTPKSTKFSEWVGHNGDTALVIWVSVWCVLVWVAGILLTTQWG